MLFFVYFLPETQRKIKVSQDHAIRIPRLIAIRISPIWFKPVRQPRNFALEILIFFLWLPWVVEP